MTSAKTDPHPASLRRAHLLIGREDDRAECIMYGGLRMECFFMACDTRYMELMAAGIDPATIGVFVMPVDEFVHTTKHRPNRHEVYCGHLRDLTDKFDQAYGYLGVAENVPKQVVAVVRRGGKILSEHESAAWGDIADIESRLLDRVGRQTPCLPDTIIMFTNSVNEDKRIAVVRPTELGEVTFTFVDKVIGA